MAAEPSCAGDRVWLSRAVHSLGDQRRAASPAGLTVVIIRYYTVASCLSQPAQSPKLQCCDDDPTVQRTQVMVRSYPSGNTENTNTQNIPLYRLQRHLGSEISREKGTSPCSKRKCCALLYYSGHLLYRRTALHWWEETEPAGNSTTSTITQSIPHVHPHPVPQPVTLHRFGPCVALSLPASRLSTGLPLWGS